MSAIAYSLYINVTKNEDAVLYLHSKILAMNLVSYLFPILGSIILISLNKFGVNNPYYCWLNGQNIDDA